MKERRSCQLSVNGSLSRVAEAASGVPQGSVLAPILFIIYVNDLADNLTIDHLLYADDVKLSAPENKRLPSKPLVPNGQRTGTQSSTLPKVNTNPGAYVLTTRTSSNAQPIQTVSTVQDQGLHPNTGFSADDNVTRATKKPVE